MNLLYNLQNTNHPVTTSCLPCDMWRLMIISCVATFDAAKTDDTAWFALIRLTYYINPSCHQSDKAGCFGGILPCVCVCVRTIIEKNYWSETGQVRVYVRPESVWTFDFWSSEPKLMAARRVCAPLRHTF